MRNVFGAVALIAALTFGGQAVWAQDYNKGLAAAKAGDFETALREWRPLAEQGNAGAQCNLGLMYDNGEGVPQDDAETGQTRLHLCSEDGSRLS